MEELISFAQGLGKDLTVLDIALIWLVWKLHKEVFLPTKKLLYSLDNQIKCGGLSHAGIEEELNTIGKALTKKV